MIARRFGPAVFVLILSGIMSAVVSGVATVRLLGWDAALPHAWLAAWLSAWCIAFPVALIAVPLARRAVDRLVLNCSTPSLRADDIGERT